MKHLLVSGDSFSYSGVGGCPPTETSCGGCSYIPDPDYTAIDPTAWPGFLSLKMSVQSLVNVAAGSHGNILVSYTIFELLKKYSYTKQDTIIIFNLSDPYRLDIPCDFQDANSSEFIPWNEQLLSHSYLAMTKRPRDIKFSDAIEKFTSQSARFLMEYLKKNEYNFYFLLMNNYLDHKYLGPVIHEFNDHLIQLDPGPSMLEFAVKTNTTVSDEDHHPNLLGHKQIADIIYDKIINN